MNLHNDDIDFTNMVDGATVDTDGINTDLNVYEMAAVGVGALIAVNGVAVCAAAAPLYTGTLLAGGGGLAYVGHRKRNNLPLNPFDKSDEVKSEPAPVVQAPDQPVQVEGFDGQPQMV